MSELLGQVKRDSYAGDFVLKSQGTAEAEGFGHVSQYWYPQTKSYEQGFEELEAGKAVTEDIIVPLNEATATIDGDGKLVFQFQDGRKFYPTLHAIEQAGSRFGTGTWYAKQLFNRAALGDGKALAYAFQHGKTVLESIIKESTRKQEKYLFRTRKDGSLRAILTADYLVIDNRWYLEVIKEIIPGGRLSHWRGDSDTIYGNVLIPDTIRQEADSDYGGMVSLGNCEIGTRAMINLPSVFRAICMNGCIWDQEIGKGVKQVHRGKLDLKKLKADIVENVNKQIPLLTAGVDLLLNTRTYKDTISPKPLIAQLALDYGFSKGQATGILNAYGEEVLITPEHRGSLFAVVNAVTRAGQQFGNADWLRADLVAGELVNYEKDDWASLTGRAARLKADKVEEAYLSK